LITVDLIAGARPNFMKAAAICTVASQFPKLTLRLVHTGQHYDEAMSDVFFKELGLPEPVTHLECGSGTHAAQTALVMERYGTWIQSNRPDMCMVVGDVNSTVACALVAAKEHIPVAHVEAGLRSFDRTMPEEINRIVTDAIADMLFVTEQSGVENLLHEGRDRKSIYLAGNVMIDTLFRMLPLARQLGTLSTLGLQPGAYVFLTLHRPSNVDDPQILAQICDQIKWLAEQFPVLFAVHPRTRARLKALPEASSFPESVRLVDPLGYLDSLCLLDQARCVVTDSGGLQEESSALGVPCFTLRDNTERPITLTRGTNTLIGGDWQKFRAGVSQLIHREKQPERERIPFWDGHAAERILAECVAILTPNER
jgi:UDP-N-acetylglucosamine 2-epimerase (non-hydrolysing)